MRLKGPWSESEVWRYLDSTVVPARLACHTGSDWPATATLWFTVEDGAIWCATPDSAAVARWLARDSRCSIEVAPDRPPYSGVRTRARATLRDDPDRAILRKVIHRYLGSEDSQLARWLLNRDVREMAIRIDPLQLTSWDFGDRMGPAVTPAAAPPRTSTS